MKRITYFSFLTLVISILPRPLLADDSRLEQIHLVRSMLSDLRELNNIPALSVAVARHGELIAEVNIGERDIRNHFPATPDTEFRLASVSKVIGATMLAKLVQDGLLDPDAQIGDYMLKLPIHFQGLTTRQLLAHTSGMPHYQARDALITATHYALATDAVASVGGRALRSEPGQEYHYSSHAYTLLSALYETIAGKPLYLAISQFIAQLTGQYTPRLENLTKRNPARSNLFEITANGPKTLKPNYTSHSPFGAGLIATAGDLALFGDAVLHSELLTEKTRTLLSSPTYLNDGRPTGTYLFEVAFGWRVGQDPIGRRVMHHAGVTPGARSVLIIYPEHGLSIALLSNSSWVSQIERTGFALADIFIESQMSTEADSQIAFTGVFGDESIQGHLRCTANTNRCHFSDNGGGFSRWLTRFNHISKDAQTWPIAIVSTGESHIIKLTTSVGFADLRPDPDSCARLCYQAPFGRDRYLKLRLETAL